MTRRGVALGFLGAMLLCLFAFHNDQVIRNTFITGNFLPPAVFGGLLLLVVVVNPLLRLLRRRPLSAAELAVASGIWLFAVFPAGRSFSHFFGNFLMLPHHWQRVTPAWAGGPTRVRIEDLRDREALRRLLAEGRSRPAGDPLREIAARLPDGVAAAEDLPADAALAALNAVIEDSEWAERIRWDALPQPPATYAHFLAQKKREARTDAESRALNRALVEAALPGVIAPRTPAILEAVPPQMLADPSADPRRMLDGYVAGLRETGRPFPLRAVPWAAWRAPLRFWLPVLCAFGVGLTGLALLLHRQWMRHERLPFPTAEAIRGLLPEPGRRVGPALRQRGFWIACGLVFAIHFSNYLGRWFTDYFIPINLRLDFRPLLELAPIFRQSGGEALFTPTIYFTAVGFAFYLASDVSLSLALGPALYVLAAGIAAGFGVSFASGGGHLNLQIFTAIYAGAAVGIFAVVVWTGRHYYGSAFAAALGGARARAEIGTTDVWGARLAIAGLSVFVLQLIGAGVEWPVAALYALFTVMVFVTMARLLAEGGTIFYHPYGSSCVMVWLLMGTRALGYQQLLLISLVSTLLLIESREAFLPLAMTALKAADDHGVRLGRLAAWGGAAAAIGLALAAVASIYWQYREGALKTGDAWTSQGIPQMSLTIAARVLGDTQARGDLDRAHRETGARRWLRVAPNRTYLIAFGATLALVLALTFLRHRFAGWPLHPIFLMLGPTYEGRVFAFSFFLGWLIKSAALKYGGAGVYQKLKAPMLGLVFGEVLATVVPIAIGALYSAFTGTPPRTMRVLPG